MEEAPAAGAPPALRPTETDFARLLRDCRRAAGLTQEALAERSGVSIRAISDLERGVKRSPRFDTTRMLADGLGLTGETRAAFAAVARRGSRLPGPHRPAVETGEPRNAPVPDAATPIPVSAEPLLGRAAELAEIAGLLRAEQTRLVTLTGPGGVGKTRLALAVTAEAVPAIADGVIFVELGSLTDPALVPAAVGAALGVRESADQPLDAALRIRLIGRRVLLVLDNCEHLLSAAAALVTDLLAACPPLRVLTTSRARLRLRAERVLRVPPLAVPSRDVGKSGSRAGEGTHPDIPHPESTRRLADFASVQLFVERARAAWPDFVLTEANAPTVALICARLDGLPLAIELAAARLRLLSPADLLALLSDRLQVLTGGPADAPRRQRTLRDLIGWSHDLLAPEEQTLFRRLAVFAAAADLEAVAAVAGNGDPFTALEGLEALAGQSLVERVGRADGPARFAMLETVKAFARERLEASDDAAAMRDAHAAHYLVMAERMQSGVVGDDRGTGLRRLDAEYANLRAALGWAIERGQTETALRLGSALVPFWLVRGHLSEGRRWLERALDAAGAAQDLVRGRALVGAGDLAQAQGDYEQAMARYDASLTICRALDDLRGTARALVNLGTVAANRGATDEATLRLQEGLALAQSLSDDSGVASALTGLGHLASDLGDYPRASALYAESLARQRAVGDAHGVAGALNNLGIVARLQGDLAGAEVLHEQSLALRREVGDRPGEAAVLNNLANVAYARGELAAAATLHQQSLAIERDLGNQYGVAGSLHNLATIALDRGELDLAVALFAESLGLFAQIGDRLRVGECLLGLALATEARGEATQAARLIGAAETLGGWRVGEDPEYERNVAALRTQLGQAAFAAAMAAGSTRTLDQILTEVALASDLSSLAREATASERSLAEELLASGDIAVG